MRTYGMIKKDFNESEDYGRFNAAMADGSRNRDKATKKRIKRTVKKRERKLNNMLMTLTS